MFSSLIKSPSASARLLFSGIIVIFSDVYRDRTNWSTQLIFWTSWSIIKGHADWAEFSLIIQQIEGNENQLHTFKIYLIFVFFVYIRFSQTILDLFYFVYSGKLGNYFIFVFYFLFPIYLFYFIFGVGYIFTLSSRPKFWNQGLGIRWEGSGYALRRNW